MKYFLSVIEVTLDLSAHNCNMFYYSQTVRRKGALVGAWRRLGGGLLLQVTSLAGKLELNPPIKALFVYNCNPVVMLPEQEQLLQGLGRDDLFVVVSEQFMTDITDFADIVLPATTQLEQFDLMYSWGHL